MPAAWNGRPVPMIHRIEIFTAPEHADPAGDAILARLRRWSGLPVEQVRTAAIFCSKTGVMSTTSVGRTGSREG